MRTLYCMVILGLMVSGAGMLSADDYYVAQSGQTPTDFKSWAGAASNIQDAVNAAAANDTVWVSNGTYTATANEVVWTDHKPLRLRGTGDRDAIVIDGEGARRGIRITGLSGSPYILISGLTITNCTHSGYGAGMSIYHYDVLSGTAVVENCTITDNEITGSANWGGGGGIHSWGQPGSGFLTVVSNCTIRGNISMRDGGGAVFYDGRSIVQDCHVASNEVVDTDYAGGGLAYHGAKLGSRVKNCIIEHNTTGDNFGGGNYAGGIFATDTSSLLVENSRIQYNRGGYSGGMVLSYSSTGTLYNCLISHNRSAYRGGGLYIVKSDALFDVDSCTIVSNRAVASPGGGIYLAEGTVNVRNSIVYHNDASSSSNTYGTVNYSYSCVAPLQTGPSNIMANPQFVSLEGGDLHLTKTSPCFNTGTNIHSWMDTAVDLDGYPRIDSYRGIVDRGCYELPPKGTLISIH